MKYLLLFKFFKFICVALFARAWIEIATLDKSALSCHVALFARAWIEIKRVAISAKHIRRRPLCEGVD